MIKLIKLLIIESAKLTGIGFKTVRVMFRLLKLSSSIGISLQYHGIMLCNYLYSYRGTATIFVAIILFRIWLELYFITPIYCSSGEGDAPLEVNETTEVPTLDNEHMVQTTTSGHKVITPTYGSIRQRLPIEGKTIVDYSSVDLAGYPSPPTGFVYVRSLLLGETSGQWQPRLVTLDEAIQEGIPIERFN